jgi:DNA helicase-2/ATP-dependent DNA helicase PcrA
MERSPYTTDATVRIITGPAHTGKTTALVGEALALVRGGVSPDDIVIFAATADACLDIKRRLEDGLKDDDALPRITTPYAFELELLSTPRCVRATGRKARVLMRFEERVLMEDLKTTGITQKRLREMVRFLERSHVDLEPMDDDWFYSIEEKRVWDLRESCLSYYGAYAASDVAPTAFGLAEQGMLEHANIAHVLVDDYQSLSKASQCLISQLATQTLLVASDEHAAVVADEEFVYAQGSHDLAAANPSCTRTESILGHASQNVTSALNTLCADEAFGTLDAMDTENADTGSFNVLAYPRPRDEFQGVADIVERRMSDGMPASQIAVGAPSRTWVINIRKTLTARGIPSSTPERVTIAGDPRKLDGCTQARILTMLRLAANPRDQLALRCWCGFGNYLTNSGFFNPRITQGAKLALDVDPAPADSDSNALLEHEMHIVAQAFDQARRIVASLDCMTGRRLLDAAAHAIAPDAIEDDYRILARIVDALPATASARDICRAVEHTCTFQHPARDGVFVGTYEEALGLSKDTVIVSGLANGLIPSREYFDPTIVERDKRPALLARSASRVYACAGVAHTHLYLTRFTEANLVNAERLKLKTNRIRFIDGKRVCEIGPSETIRAITGERFHD